MNFKFVLLMYMSTSFLLYKKLQILKTIEHKWSQSLGVSFLNLRILNQIITYLEIHAQ